MMAQLRGAYEKLPPILKYLLISIFVTVVDAAIVWVLSIRMGVGLGIANTMGVVVGQVIHYGLASGQVFEMEFGTVGAVIYFGTFLLGLLLANWIITTVFALCQGLMGKNLAFLVSKGCSVVGPFFALYFLRKGLYACVKRRRSK